jgi:hypothetical protein
MHSRRSAIAGEDAAITLQAHILPAQRVPAPRRRMLHATRVPLPRRHAAMLSSLPCRHAACRPAYAALGGTT